MKPLIGQKLPSPYEWTVPADSFALSDDLNGLQTQLFLSVNHLTIIIGFNNYGSFSVPPKCFRIKHGRLLVYSTFGFEERSVDSIMVQPSFITPYCHSKNQITQAVSTRGLIMHCHSIYERATSRLVARSHTQLPPEPPTIDIISKLIECSSRTFNLIL